jgi:pyrophosphatase PpaX
MTTPPPPTPILLDLDGTLIATRQLYVEAFARALHPHVGRHMSEPEIMALHPKSEIRFLRSQVGDRLLPEVLDHFYREYDALHPELFRGFYRGALEVVDELRRRGVPLGLVTGKSRRAWDITLRHLDPGAFDVLVFDDDVVSGKPDPEGLHWALALLTEQGRVSPDAVPVYVGDSVTDLDAAVEARLRPVGTLWSKKEEEREDFAAAVAERDGVLLRTPEDLLTLV